MPIIYKAKISLNDMKFERSELPNSPETELTETIDSLWEKLPDLGRELIRENQDLTNDRNQRFLDNPDDYLEHKPRWHQWGIITHSKMFDRAYNEEVPQYLQEWNCQEKIQNALEEKIDGVSKKDLLHLVAIFHDLGKFSTRKLSSSPFSASFSGHEKASGEIIRAPEFSAMLRDDYHLTDAQIEYIASGAELHYELGTVRDAARKSVGYNLEFPQQKIFKNKIQEIADAHPNYQLEIGLLFLADSLAKTDIRIVGDADRDIADQESAINHLIAQRGLNPKLITAIKQLPVNCAVAKAYLENWSDQQPK